jgi:hypothetical protein
LTGLTRTRGKTTKVRVFLLLILLRPTLKPPVRAVLDWVMIYWLSRAGPAASLRTYYEYAHASPAEKALLMRPLALPFGVSLFPKELSQPPLACVSSRMHAWRAR